MHSVLTSVKSPQIFNLKMLHWKMYFSTYSWSTLLLGNKEFLAFNVISVPVQSNDADGITFLSAEGMSCFQIKTYTRY